ncbi:hypothetical protein COT42_02385 [Candidatus Saganbacteria bacterium CG08_land_8_20_14_0_20_45_16]|uniref:RecF/RecN/SMC N-terminal domain-containing protein n=1 Tax=Candidatus Saganbacteria bacterium CG08_land_8_20_14_0_20_45_16 TaxID=2014293 RepID=A0A2H0Y0B5_UNCSA|nr:MAG: hypothetical protein COT42_02385 [Candidatus Saganbacteria bacterium CG08_land_8_20_14_0_20_45_16]
MFLKSLILRGFKTFADQTEIVFADDSRITAVVGPNGCGKSNLMDATRWVLAEDNPRELRVANLSNIIFAGTASRKALSLAEVTMTFDNSTNKFPLPFSEVAIKRRTFREGESEFFINKNSCRLKDIKDLLLDTGLGESTYSIITQGQVDAILSSKGEERRAVFEEAAGINKYKTRKESAKRKLIAAEQNILRISDLKVEVAEHITVLEEQAKTARHYLEVQNQVKGLDLGLSKRLLTTIFEKRDHLTAELEKARSSSLTKKQAEDQDLTELDNLKNSHRKLEQEIDVLFLQINDEKNARRDLELDRRFTESELGRSEKSLAVEQAKLGQLKDKVELLQKELTQEKQGVDLSDTPFAKTVEAILAQFSQLVTAFSKYLNALGKNIQLNLVIGRSPEKEETLKLKVEMVQEEIKRTQQNKAQLETALNEQRQGLADLNEKLKTTQLSEEHDKTLQQKRQDKEALVKTIAGLETKIRKQDQLKKEALSTESSLEIALAKLDGELGGIRERLFLEYNLSLEEVAATNYEIPNIAKAKKEIEEGKEKLRSLEPVNLLAIDEFDKAKERLSFIDAQLNDLSSARIHLESLITELDSKAEQTFVATMAQLSQVFSETFAKLFVGGEAKISLAPDAPPLEAEIDISVRPSGRKWLPLPLLSGGERSLSAIAILFSLLKIRPSPFVFMDEVDAALDDANIGRFTEMLKEFSNHSQIIVISHNKRTMAVADNIYGVTMEEPGISRIISMRLAETTK